MSQKLWSTVGRRIGTERRSLLAERLLAFLRALDRHNSVRTANAMAFDLFLALVPALGLAGWAISAVLARSPDALLEGSIWLRLTPHEFSDFLTAHLGAFSGGAFAPLALVSAWWLWSSAFVTAIGVFEETLGSQRRNWLEVRALSLGFALLAMALLVAIAALTLVTSFDLFGFVDALPLGRGALRYSIFAASALALTGFLALFYRYSIIKPGVRRRIWPGAVLAIGLGTAASVGLAVYAPSLGRYTLFYGSLAAVVVLLLWLWLCCSAILIGAEYNSALELRSASDFRTARDFREALVRGSAAHRPGDGGRHVHEATRSRTAALASSELPHLSPRPSAPPPESALWAPGVDSLDDGRADTLTATPNRPSPTANPGDSNAGEPSDSETESSANEDQRAALESVLPTQTPKSTGKPGGV